MKKRLFLLLFFTAWPSFAQTKQFWVWDLSVMPPGFRRIEAEQKNIGQKSTIYVEKSLIDHPVTDQVLTTMHESLEVNSASAIFNNQGIIPLEELVFAPLPSIIQPDNKLTILFTNLGSYNGHKFDGHFNPYDQMKEEQAWQEYQQHSNETNIIYIDPYSLSAATNAAEQTQAINAMTAIISHELQHLLAYYSPDTGQPIGQDVWLSETEAEAAMLFSGYFTDQDKLAYFSNHTNQTSLVSQTYVQYGPQILFASYLIDLLEPNGGFSTLLHQPQVGREAIEKLIEGYQNRVVPFDVIFSKFISYLYEKSEGSYILPGKWGKAAGLTIPKLKTIGTIDQIPFIGKASLAPYSFALFSMQKKLPPDANVTLTPIFHNKDSACFKKGELLWKPLASALAVYFVGCEYTSTNDLVDFEISITTKSSEPISKNAN